MHMPSICLTRTDHERAVKAAATRQSNQDTAIAWSCDVEGHLLWSDDAIMATRDAQLGRHLQAWERAVATIFSNGCYWPGAWPGGFPKSKSTHQPPIFLVFRLPGQETKSTRVCNKNYLNALFQSFKSIRKLLLNRTMS